jgi:hypothetical protein
MPSVLQIYQPMQHPRVLKLCVASHFSPLLVTLPYSAKDRKGSVLFEDGVSLPVHVTLFGVNGKVWTVGGVILTGEDRIPRRKKPIPVPLYLPKTHADWRWTEPRPLEWRDSK